MNASTRTLMDAVERLHAGDRETARDRLEALARAGGDTTEDRMRRCVACHYLADAQDDPRLELEWDRQALAHARSVDEPDAALAVGPASVTLASFWPSLCLAVAAGHAALGELEPARDHATRAEQHLDALPESPLGRMTADAIARLRRRLDPPP